MKRIIVLLLTALLVFSLAACNRSAAPATTAPAKTTAPTETTVPTETDPPAPIEATIEETTLVDQDGIKIVATELKKTLDGYTLKLELENHSGQNLFISNDATYVNNGFVYSVMLCEVADGKKASATLEIFREELELYGFDTIGTITTAFSADTEDLEEYFTTDLITLETSAVGSIQFTPDENWKVLYDKNDIRILLVEVIEGPKGLFALPGMRLYIENNGTDSAEIFLESISVNDYMDEGFMDVTLHPGTQALALVELYKLEENGIEKIENVEFTLGFYDPNTLYEELLPSETITVEFEG